MGHAQAWLSAVRSEDVSGVKLRRGPAQRDQRLCNSKVTVKVMGYQIMKLVIREAGIVKVGSICGVAVT